MMKNIIIFSLLAICSAQVWATESVRIRTDVDLVITGQTNGTIQLTAEKPSSGAGDTEAIPANVYIPMERTAAPPANKLYYIGASPTGPDIFNTTSSYYINFPLRINTDGSTRYLYAAVKDSAGTYRAAKSYGLINGSTVNGDVIFTLSPTEICAVIGTDCANLAAGSTTEALLAANVYFFVSDQSSYAYGASGSQITPSASITNTGMYFKVNMSNSVQTDAKIRITLAAARSGDKRLILTYTASGTLDAAIAKSVRVYRHTTNSASATNAPIGSYTNGSLIGDEFPYQQNGSITIAGLTNETPYTVSLLFVDKYNFATTLSNDITGEPKTIEELLKKQACFLLTAGFGEEHYVITYFRHFRDTVLAESFLGRKFIHFYYGNAPKYALMIYKHDSIRAFIRGIGYSLYFIFNYYIAILISLVVVVSGIYLYKNREKIKI